MKTVSVYDKTDVKKEIQEKIDELKAICGRESLPMFVSLAISNDEEKTTYMSDFVDPILLGLNLNDDKMHEHMKVLEGFVTVPKDRPLEMEAETIAV